MKKSGATGGAFVVVAGGAFAVFAPKGSGANGDLPKTGVLFLGPCGPVEVGCF